MKNKELRKKPGMAPNMPKYPIICLLYPFDSILNNALPFLLSLERAGSRSSLFYARLQKTGRMPTEEELAKRQRIIPILNGILQGKGLVKVAEDKILVTGLGWKGPLEEGWQKKVEAFVARISIAPGTLRRSPAPNR